ncbi:ParA family protein [Microcoleus sp. FACHB-1515]|uniref:ParA family protein n=1 Tax=Cyanophyceae TaxID=3028117 RepID=UPI001687E3AF|nr:ParA family protein [Microcoleus sp. FACHB-1515]MBD2089078.1 ParA family protein [Microcoleus sp. FACHB-1515]
MPKAVQQVRIAIESNTGGSGKTTLSTHLAYALGKKGYRVVLIDLDQNGSLSLFSGKATTPEKRQSLAIVFEQDFKGDYPLLPIWNDHIDTVRLIQGSAPLEDVIRSLHLYERKYEVLRDRLEDYPLDADVVILDTPASLEPMGLIALAASTHILVPLKPEYKDSFGAAGMVNWFYQKIESLRLRPQPEILGFVPSRVNVAKFAAHRNLLGIDKQGKPRTDIDLNETIPYQLQQMGITCFPPIKESGFILSASGTGLPVHLYQPGDAIVRSFDPIVSRIIDILRGK